MVRCVRQHVASIDCLAFSTRISMCGVDEVVYTSRDDCRVQHPLDDIQSVQSRRLHITTNTASSPSK